MDSESGPAGPIKLIPVGLGEVVDGLPDTGEGVAAVGGEVLGDAEGGEEIRGVREDIGGGLAGVEVAEGAGNGFDDEGIGIAVEMALAVLELGNEPEFGEAAGDEVIGSAEFGGERREFFGAGDEQGETVLAVFEDGEFGDETGLFFREGHF